MAHPELGSRILDAVIEQVGSHGKVETQARLEGRNMTMVLAPEKKAIVKKPHEPKGEAHNSKAAANGEVTPEPLAKQEPEKPEEPHDPA